MEGEGLETGGWISPAEHTSEVAAAWDRAADREAEVMEGYLKDLQEGREMETDNFTSAASILAMLERIRE